MATQTGAGHIYGLDSGAPFTQADLNSTYTAQYAASYVSPKIETLRISHASNVDRIKNAAGNTSSCIYSGESLECTFEVIPQGTTQQNAIYSGGLPPLGKAFGITGLQVVNMGSWTDALNVTSGDPGQNPWIYEGGGTINGFTDGKWTMTLPLKRYRQIASAAAIS